MRASIASPPGRRSPVLLITDLGRPARFYNMLRVFKVTSPMSVGSWILAATGAPPRSPPAHEVLGLFDRARARRRAAASAAASGCRSRPTPPRSRRTRPCRSGTRRGASCRSCSRAARRASAGAAAAIATPAADAGPARRLAVLGVVGSRRISMQVMERRLGELAEPYRARAGGRLRKARTGLLGRAARRLVAARGHAVAPAAAAGGAMVLAGCGVPSAGRSSRRGSSRRTIPSTRSARSVRGSGAADLDV